MHVAFLLLLGFGVKPLGYDALLYSIIRRWYSSLSSVMVHAITDLIAKYRQQSRAWISASLLGPKVEHDETGRICKTSQSGVTPSSSLQACFSLVLQTLQDIFLGILCDTLQHSTTGIAAMPVILLHSFELEEGGGYTSLHGIYPFDNLQYDLTACT